MPTNFIFENIIADKKRKVNMQKNTELYNLSKINSVAIL